MTQLLGHEGDAMDAYELVVIISPEITEEEMPDTVSKVSGLINKTGGNVIEISQWGRRKLAYPIKRCTEGNYMLAHLELDPATAKDLEANLRLTGEVLRHLLIRAGE